MGDDKNEIIEYRYEELPTKRGGDLIRYGRIPNTDEYVMDTCFLHPSGLDELRSLGLSPYADIDHVITRVKGNCRISMEAVYKEEVKQ